MTHQQLIEKWEGQLSHWKNASYNHSFTEEYRNKALYYASSISALLIDLKDMDRQEEVTICFRDKARKCNLCHECDIDVSNPELSNY